MPHDTGSETISALTFEVEHLRAQNEQLVDRLREASSRLELAAHDNRFLRDREESFIKALNVCDGGRYRADWPGAMDRCIRDRDSALKAASELNRDYENALLCIAEMQKLALARNLRDLEGRAARKAHDLRQAVMRAARALRNVSRNLVIRDSDTQSAFDILDRALNKLDDFVADSLQEP